MDASEMASVFANREPQIAVERILTESVRLEKHEVSRADFLNCGEVDFFVDSFLGSEDDPCIVIVERRLFQARWICPVSQCNIADARPSAAVGPRLEELAVGLPTVTRIRIIRVVQELR